MLCYREPVNVYVPHKTLQDARTLHKLKVRAHDVVNEAIDGGFVIGLVGELHTLTNFDVGKCVRLRVWDVDADTGNVTYTFYVLMESKRRNVVISVDVEYPTLRVRVGGVHDCAFYDLVNR